MYFQLYCIVFLFMLVANKVLSLSIAVYTKQWCERQLPELVDEAIVLVR